MKRSICIIVAVMLSFAAHAGDVLVVKAGSLESAAERNYTDSIIRGLGRLLDDLGIDWDTATEQESTEGLLGRYPVVLLPHNPTLSAKTLEAFRGYTANGGKLMVFYSSDRHLAQLMGFRLGNYTRDEVANRWCAVRFTPDAPPGMPDVFYQESRNIRPVYPDGKPARTIAYWETGRGQRTQYPAIVMGARGLWMSHVLLPDMDEEGKRMMLLEAISAYAPSVEKKAAGAYLGRIERAGSFSSFDVFLASINGNATDSMIKYLADRYEKVKVMRKKGDYRECVNACVELRGEMESVYAASVLGGQKGRMAVWDHSGRGLYVGDWPRTCQVLKKAGITDVYCNLMWPWEAHLESSIAAKSRVFNAIGDQGRAAIDSAHAKGIKMHLWKVCWTLESAPAETVAEFRKQGRLQQDYLGKTVNWLCPSHPENVRMEKDLLREALRKYEFDGVHLDYIRYKDSSVCYCANCRKAFQKIYGPVAGSWPAAVRTGPLAKQYSQWRVKQISDFVRDVDTLTSRLRPRAEVSAAVFGKYPSCVPSVAQDWVSWVKNGYVDYVCPMDYTGDLARFKSYVESQVKFTGDASTIVPGIGVTARESTLDVFQVVDQIKTARQLNVDGVILFDLNRKLEESVLPVLR